MGGTAVGADFQPFDVGGRMHRLPRIGQLAPARIPVGQPLEAELTELVHDFLADFTVEHAVGVGRVLEDERDVENAEQRHNPGVVGRAGNDDVNGAAARTGDGSLGIAQRTVRENLDLKCALGLGFEQFVHLLATGGLWVAACGFRSEAQDGLRLDG